MINEVPQENKSIIQLNKLIKKSRLHFYKPIQIAEILFHHRTKKNFNLKKIETYRNISKNNSNILNYQDLCKETFLKII